MISILRVLFGTAATPHRSLCFDELDDQALLEKVARLLRHHRHLRRLSRYYKIPVDVLYKKGGVELSANTN